MDLSARISELLYHYDCVIVPDLGGFVTEYRSARIDKLLHVIHPPSKDLRFNAQLTKNDGLLAHAISQAENISHEAANAQIKEAVEGYFTELEEGRPVQFEKVGILYLDSEKNLQFSPDTSVNYLLESFRLKKVYARPVLQEVPEHQEIDVEEEIEEAVIDFEPEFEVVHEIEAEEAPGQEEEEHIPVIPLTKKEEGSGSRRWLIAAAMVPLLFYIAWVGVRSDVLRDGTIQSSDLNPFHKQVPAVYEGRTSSLDVDLNENEIPKQEALAPISTPEAPEEEFTEDLTPTESPETISDEGISEAEAVSTYVAPQAISSMEFHVIGGCFSEESNATRLVERLRTKGYEAFIIDRHRGLHRVAYGSSPDRKEALELLIRVKEEETSEAWLLRKK
ncbi:MAG: HU-CCDC81 and SPOR domain-containing protein [Flavobacteriales bacterium]|nr:HU-CCDC81 and SPOR domain-containing protein [Flavobacteriales bacterium]